MFSVRFNPGSALQGLISLPRLKSVALLKSLSKKNDKLKTGGVKMSPPHEFH